MPLEISAPTALPTFVSNQVLTAQLLNNLRDYLDKQTRLSILRGVGRGIACGLEVTVGTGNLVTITEGHGFTSEGYLIQYAGGAFTHVQVYNDPIYTMLTTPNGNKKDFDPEDYKYEKWQNPTVVQPPLPQPRIHQQIGLLELVTASQTPSNTTRRLLTPADLANHLVVLFLEFNPENLRSCVSSDCNNKGWEINLTVKPLLIPRPAALTPALCLSKERLRVQRLHIDAPLFPAITSSPVLLKKFKDIAKLSLDELDKRILASYNELKNTLDLGAVVPALARPKILDPINNFEQYEYDFAKDLTDAFNEFYAASCAFVNNNCHPLNDFARHLTLGAGDFTEGYRHVFEPSKALLLADEDRQNVKNLFKRLTTLIANFNPIIPTTATVKLTPSRSEAYPLGSRAVPSYYNFNNVKDIWQPKNCCANEILPLAFSHDYAKTDFIEIKGHIGKEPYATLDTINAFKKANNIEFDVIPIFLTNTLNSKKQFSTFASNYTGLEHLGGVPKGGTLILLCEIPTGPSDPNAPTERGTPRIVADFALSGSLEECCSCCNSDFNLPSEHFTIFYNPAATTRGGIVTLNTPLAVLRRFLTIPQLLNALPIPTKQQATLAITTTAGIQYSLEFNVRVKPTLEDCFQVEIQSGGIRDKFDVTVLVLPQAQVVDNTPKVTITGIVEQQGVVPPLGRRTPVANAIVQVGVGRTLSKENGKYELVTQLPFGEHLATAQTLAGVIDTFSPLLKVTQDGQVFQDVDFLFGRGAGVVSITGRILVNNEPIRPNQGDHVDIVVRSSTGAVVIQNTFQVVPNLNYSFSNIAPGIYKLEATLFKSPGSGSVSGVGSREANVVAGQTLQADINIQLG